MPWVMMVDSSATIGFLCARAPATSGEKSIRSAAVISTKLQRAAIGSCEPIIGNRRPRINGVGGACVNRSERRLAGGLARYLKWKRRLGYLGRTTRLSKKSRRRGIWSLGTDAMDEKPEVPQAPSLDLAAAIQRARLESGERAQAKGLGVGVIETSEMPPTRKPDLAAVIQRARLESSERAQAEGLGTDAMDEKPEVPQPPKPDLAAAVRRARVENAERAEAIAELREIEMGRLALLERELKPVVREAPPGVDMFDLTLSPGERPRLFLDMVAFVEMGRDRRTYRFFQDTLHGRVLIAESQQIERIVAAVTNYVARRLVERERALAAASGEERAVAAESGDDSQQPAVWPTRQVEPAAEWVSRKPEPPEAKAE